MKKQTITTYGGTYPTIHTFNPSVHIAVKNNRMKSYYHEGEKRVYLEDGTEFQLEFYNDSDSHAKAVIEINGKKENCALILRPYERFYLDRFMDTKKKLKFNTFMTGNDDIEKLKEIIAKNGKIKISFHKQYILQPFISWSYAHVEPIPWDYSDSTGKVYPFYGHTTSGGSSLGAINSYNMTNTKNIHDVGEILSKTVEEPKEIETGRVEVGKKSDQDFVQSYESFEILPSRHVEYHIVPVSQKPKIKKVKKQENIIRTSDIRTYCSTCGRKVKKGWNFCPGCGNNF